MAHTVQLVRLEITGFKSFRDRTDLPIPSGITAIVGPNGTGKSNLVDAVLWGLGHQSARDLRSGRMGDVIYAGPPNQGHASFAEVALSFAVQEDDAVENFKVTRRVFRDGQSEYEINGKRVRLKDVVDFCDRYRILAHAYTVIPQGQITLLCEMRPKELRMFLEDVAGLSLYKRKKEETQHKMDRTYQNLQRLYDLIQELEAQWEQKKHQAERTQRYLDLQERIRRMRRRQMAREARRLLRSRRRLERELQRLRQELEPVEQTWVRLQTERDRAWQEAERIQADIVRLQAEQESAEQRLRARREEHQEMVSNIESLEMERKRFIEKIEENKKETKKIRENIIKNRKEYENALTKLEELKEEHEDMEDQWARFVDQWSREEEQMARLREERAGLQARLHDLEAHVAYWVEMASKFRTELKQKRRSLDQHRTQAAGVRKEYEAAREQQLECARRVEAVRARVADLEQARREARRQLDACIHRREVGRRALEEKRQERDDLASALLEADEVKPELETRLQEQIRSRGLQDRVARLRDVVAERGESDVPFWLPFFDRDWVAYDRTSAQQLAQVMQTVGYPPRMIWILDEIPVPETSHTGRLTTPYSRSEAGPLADRMDRILRSFQPVSDVEQIQGPWVYHETERLVRLPGGLYWGGPEGASGSRWYLQAVARIRRLEADIPQLEREIDRAEKQRQEFTRTLQAMDSEQKRVEEQIRALEKDQESWQTRYTEAETRWQQIEGRVQELESVCRNLTDSLQQAREQEQRFRDQVAELQRRWEATEEPWTAVRDRISGMERERAKLEAQRLYLQRELGKARQVVIQVEAQGNQLEQQQDTLERRIAELKKAQKRCEAELKKWKEKKAALEKEWAQLQREQERTQERLRAAQESFQELMQRLQGMEGELAQVAAKRNRILDRIRAAEIRHADSQARWQSFQDRVRAWDSEVSLEELLDQKGAFTARDKQALLHLEAQLEALGPVNLMALEEFQALNERLTYMRRQQEDLMQALTSLNRAIEQLDRQMVQRLKETHVRLNETLNRYLKVFFRGGRGELVWQEPGDILNSGLELRVQLPGKRIRTLLQLSGGEKTLVGLALVLAANEIRPSAFVILDEVDAPLDDRNVDRLMEVLGDRARVSQFLLVTHNKRTIQYADAIYGVVSEDGVSRVLSLRLEEARETLDRASGSAGA